MFINLFIYFSFTHFFFFIIKRWPELSNLLVNGQLFPCFWYLRKWVLCFCIKYHVCSLVLVYNFYQIRKFPSIPSFLRFFSLITNRCWILSIIFSVSTWFLSFNLWMCFITLTDFLLWNHPCFPGINWLGCLFYFI